MRLCAVGQEVLATVDLRRSEKYVPKPDALKINGQRFKFYYGGLIKYGLYAGEDHYTIANPPEGNKSVWVASGDLKDITPGKSPRPQDIAKTVEP